MGFGRTFANAKVSSARIRRAGPSQPAQIPRQILPSNHALLRGRTGAHIVQPKLQLSHPSDPAEQQAEAVAARFADGVGGGPEAAILDAHPSHVHRMCDECEEERQARMISRQVDDMASAGGEAEIDEEEEDDSEPDVTGMPQRSCGSSATHMPESAIPTGDGDRMPGGVRSRMERAFGTDFRSVRLHTDAASVRSASRMGALAYTVGNHIYFGAGQYAPSTSSGARLMAHELTHVVQQRGAAPQVSPQRRQRRRRASVCAAGNCPQGKQRAVVRDDCAPSAAIDGDNFITHLEVSLSGHTVVATWSDGHTSNWPCSPHPANTPTGNDVVGVKCSIRHTNRHRDGMAWFTGFQSESLRIGFHDSQPVGPGFRSHGCVRVCCDIARIINRNTSSGVTTIHVS